MDLSELDAMSSSMRARGPDGEGKWIAPTRDVAFAHRRLSIIDLSQAAAQPMLSEDGTLVVTFNGEIYNYRALRRELEDKGHVFRSQSDTEVLLHLYADRGPDMVRALRGMFAFAIWDQGAGELLLARDPLGIKPLYWADDGKKFRFASQVKALLRSPGLDRAPDPAGWAGFYLFGSVPEPYTTYRAIRALQAGATLTIRRDRAPEERCFASVSGIYGRASRERLSPAALGKSDVAAAELLLDSVRHHLVGDVPVGLFLSAGIDSGALAGLMRDATTAPIEAITIAFEEFSGEDRDEGPLAGEVAAHYGINHCKRVVTEAEFRADLPKILAAMDQPSIDGINTWFVSKAAAEAGLKVAISGLGGDELLGGYPSFRDLPRWTAMLRAPVGPVAAIAGRALTPISPPLPPKFAALARLGGSWPGAYLVRRGIFMPWELSAVMGPDAAAAGLARLDPLSHIAARMEPVAPTAFDKVAALESSLYMRNQLLRDADWASMAHSIEVRVPLVDATLLAATAGLRARTGATIDKATLARSPSRPLPKSISARPKTGFETPIRTWLAAIRPNEVGHRREHWSRHWARMVACSTAALDFSLVQ